MLTAHFITRPNFEKGLGAPFSGGLSNDDELDRKRSFKASRMDVHDKHPLLSPDAPQPVISSVLSMPNELLGFIARAGDAASLRALRETSRQLSHVAEDNGFRSLFASRVAKYLLY